jgi:hypothetical protein
MDQRDDSGQESKVRLDAAFAALVMSSERLKAVIFSGTDEAVDESLAALRLARMRFLAARSVLRDAARGDATEPSLPFRTGDE